MNKHELDKIAVEALLPLSLEEIEKSKLEIVDFLDQFPNNYLMLLCKETNYYTFFDLTKTINCKSATQLVDAILDFILTDSYLSELGPIKHIEIHSTYVEIWISNYHFALFESSGLVVTL